MRREDWGLTDSPRGEHDNEVSLREAPNGRGDRMAPTIERVPVSGYYRASEYVTDGSMTWLEESQLWCGYRKRDIRALFARDLRERGLKVVKDR